MTRNTSYKIRESQFELMRILSMLMIVLHHFLIRADTCGYMSPYRNNIDGFIGVSLESCLIVGVNVFVLISGYFGIKHVTKPILKLIIDCFIFGSLAYIFAKMIFPPNTLTNLFHDYSHSVEFTRYWFIFDYILLVMIAPILERALNNISYETLRKIIVLLTIVNLWGGYYMRHINDNGYNYVQFAYLYILARFIRLSVNRKWLRHICKYGLVYWIISGLLLSSIFVLYTIYKGKAPNSIRVWSYNNPLVLIGSLAFFCYFIQFHFKNVTLNKMANSVLGVYLLHAGPSIEWFWFKSNFIKSVYNSYGYIAVLNLALIVFFICLLISYFVNKLIIRVGIQNLINDASIYVLNFFTRISEHKSWRQI